MVLKMQFLRFISCGEKSRVPFGIDGFCVLIPGKLNGLGAKN